MSILRVKTQQDSINRLYHSSDNIHHFSLRSAESKESIKSHHRNVSFDKVSIREYERVLGDNPSVSQGPPIRLVKLSFF